MSARSRLTPQMVDYERNFTDSGEVRWLPYLMYFHPPGHVSNAVNTDGSGFRYSEAAGHRFSVADRAGLDSVRLLAGSSTVFGIGASSDAWTLSSRMSAHDRRGSIWLNFGGRSFNSAQEMLLIALYRHLLPAVEEIVILSGFNNLGLARLPRDERLDQGAFFNCNQFLEAFGDAGRGSGRSLIQSLGDRWRAARSESGRAGGVPSTQEQIRLAADLTLRHLDLWRILAAEVGAKLTYVLQPLSGWVRETGSPEEEELFAELDQAGRFTDTYGTILRPEVCLEYAALLADGAKRLGVSFVNLSPVLADRITPDQWLFVDRIHFTDDGHDFVARQLLELI